MWCRLIPIVITFSNTNNTDNLYTQYQETKASRIFNLFVKALDSQVNFRYSKDPNRLCISIPLNIDAPQNHITIYIQIREFDVIVFGTYDNFNIPTSSLPDIFELLLRINDNYIYPQLVFDFNEYSIYCRHRQVFAEDLMQEGFAIETILNVGFHLEKCGKALMAVSLGLQTPEEAEKSIQNN